MPTFRRSTRARRRRAHTVSLSGLEGCELRLLLSANVLSPTTMGVPGTIAMSQRPQHGRSHVVRNVEYEDVSGRVELLDVYEPRGTPPPGGWPVIVAIHGGGWRKFDREEYGPKVAARFVSRGYVVVAPNYTLSAPGAPSWPANFIDVQNAVRWVRTNASSYHFDTSRIVAMGESAGGHLAALLGTDPNDPVINPSKGTTSDVSARVDAVIAFYAPTDLALLDAESRIGALAVEQYLGGTPAQLPLVYADASPVSHVTAGDPPMMIMQGLADSIVPCSQAVELSKALSTAGDTNRLVLVPGASHGFEFTAKGDALVPQIAAFLCSVWEDQPTAS